MTRLSSAGIIKINVGLDAWRFEPVNEAELADNWLHAALNAD